LGQCAARWGNKSRTAGLAVRYVGPVHPWSLFAPGLISFPLTPNPFNPQYLSYTLPQPPTPDVRKSHFRSVPFQCLLHPVCSAGFTLTVPSPLRLICPFIPDSAVAPLAASGRPCFTPFLPMTPPSDAVIDQPSNEKLVAAISRVTGKQEPCSPYFTDIPPPRPPPPALTLLYVVATRPQVYFPSAKSVVRLFRC